MLRIVMLAALVPSLAFAGDTCPVANVELISPRQAWHAASTAAELVAPSANASGSRRRVVAMPPAKTTNFIDAEIFGKMAADGVIPTTRSTDAEFLRRVTLDLTGQIPDSGTVLAFINDPTPDKRAKKIDQLLASDAFVDRWTMWFGDLVQNVQSSTSSREYYQGRNVYYTFIRDSIAANKPYDQLVREVLAGKGDSFAAGSPNYWVRQIQRNGPIQDTYDNLSAHSGEKFLGMPLLCLSCHNGLGHLELVNGYLKTKTRAQFWGNAAFFARTRATPLSGDPNNANVRKYDVEETATGAYQLNTTSGNKTPRQPAAGQPATVAPAFILTGEGPRTGEPWRDAYGRILTAHPQFARATVNYLWKEMFGLAMVEPVNAFDLSKQDTQPTHPNLLTRLQDEFIADHYDLRAILRMIANSDAYQLSSTYTPGAWNEAWTPYFARHYPHRVMAEELLDAIVKATNVGFSVNVQGIGPVTVAMKLPDPLEAGTGGVGGFMNSFGRGNRDDIMRSSDSSISQSLALMNNTIVTTRVKRATAGSTVSKVIAATSDPSAVADQLYLATLSRYPTVSERATAVAYLRSGTLATKAEDLQFALLNSLEFLFD